MQSIFNTLAALEYRRALRAGQHALLPIIVFCIVHFVQAITQSGLQSGGISDLSLLGGLWLALFLATQASSSMALSEDYHDNTLDMLVTSRLGLGGIIALKLSLMWLLQSLPLIALIGLYVILSKGAMLALVVFITLSAATFAMNAVGMFGATLCLGSRRAGLLHLVIITPLSLPPLIFASNLLNAAFASLPFLAAAYLLAGYVCFAMVVFPLATKYCMKSLVESL